MLHGLFVFSSAVFLASTHSILRVLIKDRFSNCVYRVAQLHSDSWKPPPQFAL